MTKITAAITAVGGYAPETRLTNFDLEKMVDTNDEWIRSRTGISERRILKEPGKGSSDLAVPAVLEILRKKIWTPRKLIASSVQRLLRIWSSRLLPISLPTNRRHQCLGL